MHLSEAAPPISLVEQLEVVVKARTNGLVRNLSIARYGNEVVLSGTTHTYYTKQLATHAVYEALQGVTLTNNIEVD
ncbi:MAG: hypothetical protein ACE5KM_06400 [Planctomycetaceae bacterium]